MGLRFALHTKSMLRMILLHYWRASPLSPPKPGLPITATCLLVFKHFINDESHYEYKEESGDDGADEKIDVHTSTDE